MNSTWLRGSRAPRIAALVLAALPTLLVWVAAQAAGFTEEIAFGWFAYTPLSIDYLMTIMRILDWTITMVQLAVPALIALAALLFVRRWTSWGAGLVLLIGGLVLGGARLMLGSGPAAMTPGEFSPLYAAVGLAACYVIAAALLFLSALRLSPPSPAGSADTTTPANGPDAEGTAPANGPDAEGTAPANGTDPAEGTALAEGTGPAEGAEGAGPADGKDEGGGGASPDRS